MFVGSVGRLHGCTTTEREADKWKSHPVTWFSTSSEITETDWYVSLYKLQANIISAYFCNYILICGWQLIKGQTGWLHKNPQILYLNTGTQMDVQFICHCCISAHPSKTHSDESRPELLLKLTMNCLAVSVLHIDPLPPPDAAHNPLGPMAAHFFNTVGPGHLAPADFLHPRTVFNQACPHDHLRCTFDFSPEYLRMEGLLKFFINHY